MSQPGQQQSTCLCPVLPCARNDTLSMLGVWLPSRPRTAMTDPGRCACVFRLVPPGFGQSSPQCARHSLSGATTGDWSQSRGSEPLPFCLCPHTCYICLRGIEALQGYSRCWIYDLHHLLAHLINVVQSCCTSQIADTGIQHFTIQHTPYGACFLELQATTLDCV